MIRLHDVNIGYHNAAPVVTAIDAALPCGTFCCLLGRNGSGKSTLLRTIAGLQPPLSGDLGVQTSDPMAIVLTQVPDLRQTKVREMVAYGRLRHTGFLGRLRDRDYTAADRAIALVGLSPLSDRRLDSLSDGERQKTMIARALAQETPYLLLDEPSAFLDYPSRHSLMELLQTLAHEQQKAILLSTHDVELAIAYADILWVLRDGHMEIKKTPQNFRPEEI